MYFSSSWTESSVCHVHLPTPDGKITLYMIFSVPRNGQVEQLQAIFRPQCMVMVKIVKIRIRANDNHTSVRI